MARDIHTDITALQRMIVVLTPDIRQAELRRGMGETLEEIEYAYTTLLKRVALLEAQVRHLQEQQIREPLQVL